MLKEIDQQDYLWQQGKALHRFVYEDDLYVRRCRRSVPGNKVKYKGNVSRDFCL
jgi:hypothetical protein